MTKDDNQHGDEQDHISRPKKHARKTNPAFANHFMLSEPFPSPSPTTDMIQTHDTPTDFPSDFFQTWSRIACPRGQRCLLVASGGQTRAYNRHGRLIETFGSVLPSGSSGAQYRHLHVQEMGVGLSSRGRDFTVLDAIRIEIDEPGAIQSPKHAHAHAHRHGHGPHRRHRQYKYVVLDVLVWRTQPFYDCSFAFRRFFIHSKFQELAISTDSQVQLAPCCRVSDTGNNFGTCRDHHWYGAEVAGYIFVHDEAYYLPNQQSPLYLWCSSLPSLPPT